MFIDQQCRAVLEGAVEHEFPQHRVTECNAPPLEQLQWDHILASLWIQCTILASRLRAADGHHVIFNLGSDVLAQTADAEEVGAPGNRVDLSDMYRLHAHVAVELAAGHRICATGALA